MSGVSLLKVEISTGTGTAQSYWTGSAWSAPLGQTWIPTTTANPWYYTIPIPALAPANGSLFYLRLQLTDNAGNIFTSATSTFTYNTTAPSVTITPRFPNNGFYSAVQVSTPFAGTTSPSGAPNIVVSTVILTLQDLTVGASYYNGSAWTSSISSIPGARNAGELELHQLWPEFRQ